VTNFFIARRVADPGDAHGRRKEARPGETLAPVGDAGGEKGQNCCAATAAAQLEEGTASLCPRQVFWCIFFCF
jgi:hypothetical protein